MSPNPFENALRHFGPHRSVGRFLPIARKLSLLLQFFASHSLPEKGETVTENRGLDVQPIRSSAVHVESFFFYFPSISYLFCFTLVQPFIK